MLWVLPDRKNSGRVCSRPVSLVDVYPTVSDILGEQPTRDHDGTSLLPLLNDPDAERSEPVLSTWQYGNHSLRDQRWHNIRYRDGSEELYDHKTDPNEHTNLASDPKYLAQKEQLKQSLPDVDCTFEEDPLADSLGKRASQWKQDRSLIPEWLK